MCRQTKIVVEEVFHSTDMEDRKRVFNEIIVRIIKKSELAKST